MGTNSAIVYYSVWSEDFPANQLFRWGHYKRNGGTKSNVLAADVLDIKSADVSGLEMEMLKGRGTPVKFVNASTDTSAENGHFCGCTRNRTESPAMSYFVHADHANFCLL